METRITLFNNIVSRNNQYDKDSHLWFSIKDAYTQLKNPELISDNQARSLAKSYCNMISLYATAFACGGIGESLESFICYGIDNGFVNPEDGFIYNKGDKTKKYYLAGLGLNIDMKYVENYSDIENPEFMEEGTFYQMKIKSRTGANHFIGCFFYKGALWMSDTSNRGIYVKVKDKIKPKDFNWLLKIG